MDRLKIPTSNLTIRKNASSTHDNDVFDIVRKKWVALTPEEYVRQSFIHYIIGFLNVPVTHISVEQPFFFDNGKPQRADIIVYKSDGTPYILIECKASSVKITKEIFTQATRYNAYIKAQYIIVTNGLKHYSLSTDNYIDYSFEKTMPDYL